MGSSSRFDQISQNLSAQASEIADAAKVESEAPVPTQKSLADDNSAVGTSVKRGNIDAANTPKPVPADAYKNESEEVKTIIRHLEHYALEAGTNKRLTRTDIISLQTTLLNNLDRLVNLPNNGDFAICLRRLLTLMRENRTGAFSLNMLNRCVSSLNKGNAAIDNYTKFLDMMVVFSDPTMRTTYIRRYNLAQGAAFAKPQHRERLIEFIRSICGVI